MVMCKSLLVYGVTHADCKTDAKQPRRTRRTSCDAQKCK